MSAYEIGTKVLIERTHEEGVISGAGSLDWGNSTSGVYAVDVGEGPQKVELVHEEDLTIPDEPHYVELVVRVKARVVAETEADAHDRMVKNLKPRIEALAKEIIEEDRHEEILLLSIGVEE